MLLVADWVVPVTSPPIRRGAVRIRDGRIEAVGPADRLVGGGASREIPGILTPGLVNAHAHLELSSLRGAIAIDRGFAHWLRQIVDRKLQWEDADLERFAADGVRELLARGVTCVGDHATRASSYRPLLDSGIRGACLIEFVNFLPEQADTMLGTLRDLLDRRVSTDRVRVGLAPHSPYAVSRPLLDGAAALGRERDLRMSIHLAEVPAEEEFLQDGEGTFKELLEYRGLWDGTWNPPRQTPIRYAQECGLLGERTVAAHANFPRNGDVALLKSSGTRVAYCPNSHAYFDHPQHPLQAYLDADIPTALGTDSLASNDHLSVLEEMKTLRERFPGIPAARILDLATRGGGTALGWEKEIGTLEPGKAADLAAFSGPDDPEADPIEHLVSATPDAILTMVGGKTLHEAPSCKSKT